MLGFGHLGIGLRMVRLARPLAPAIPILIGTILPDVIDKPLYYGAVFLTGRTSTDIGLISCTRTFGHSGLFLLAVLIPALFAKVPRARAWLLPVALGIFSHHLLDMVQDAFISEKPFLEGAAIQAFLFPFWKDHFGSMPTKTMGDHLFSFLRYPALFACEVIGAVLLLIEFFRWKKIRAAK